MTSSPGVPLTENSPPVLRIDGRLKRTTQLLPRADALGRVLAYEIMVATPVELTTSDAATPTYVGVNLTGGTLNVAELSVDYLKNTGFVIGSGVTLTAFDKVTWGANQ